MADEVIAGRYRLEEQLGAGGMSEVWRATDEDLERTVAVKLIRPDADRARFEREARAVAALSHPNINQLYDYGEAEGHPFMVLEYLPGGSLEDELTYGTPLPDARAEQIAADVAAGLAHAHARGLIHRDLKPANILFDGERRAKIADFGIARLGSAGTLTEAGTVLGTAAYISPEQAAGEPASPASDVYSFGVILFRMLTGRLPFEAEEPMSLVAAHQTQPPPAVADLRADAPARLEAVAAAALAKDPADRPPDGAALAAELAPVGATMPLAALAPTAASAATAVLPALASQAGPTYAAAGPPLPPRRRIAAPLLAAILLALAAAGAGLALLVTRSGSNSAPPPTHEPNLSLPKISSESTTEPTAPTTRPATTQQTTTRATTHRTTTAPPPLPTTIPPTTIPPTTIPPTTIPPTTTTTPPGPGG